MSALIPVTLRDLNIDAYDKFATKPVIVADGKTWTYAEVAREANRVANTLIALGIAPGERVAVMMSNCAEYVIAEQALIRAGIALVPLNDMLSDDERRHILQDSNSRAALVTRSQLAPAVEMLRQSDELERVVLVDDGGEVPEGVELWSTFLADAAETLPDVAVQPETISRISYTGGTTGKPKGVVHNQHTFGTTVLAHLSEMDLRDDDVLLATSPMPHAVGLLQMAAAIKGVKTYVERGFDLDGVLDRIENDGASYLFLVPTMIYRLLDKVVAEPARNLAALRTIVYGAAPITTDRLAQGLDLLGPVFMQLYGQTECPNWITRLTRVDHTTDPAKAHLLKSCGRATPMVRVRIVDGDNNPVPNGTTGEVALQSPYQMVGYHDRPDATEKTLRGGWLHTGDMGYLDDDGYVYLVDRKNDMIISGGMNVYSTAVENAISAQDGIAQVAVVGIEHPDWGEAVVAYVVPADGAHIDPQGIIDGTRSTLARYEVPKSVVEIEALPVTSVGKIDKKKLRAAWPGWQ
ncbi:AMP-binding protein [Cumulibacter soli]|uniref:AMP-binding protein n=1 Tax=Cumulibacter soli TaxID=2546344 RepID=UPI001067DB4C|nr:AMP-binding protein [Cumulibacter soli]